jgi:hypothetical protein
VGLYGTDDLRREIMFNLQNPHTVAYYAAMYEMDYADAEYRQSYAAFTDSGARAGSPEDYNTWATAHYADAAQRVVRDMPVWEAGA